MRRWWVVIALLLSLGFNLGLLTALVGGWWSGGDTGAGGDAVVTDGGPAAGEAEEWPHRARGPGAGTGLLAGPPLERVADHLGLEGESRQRFLALQQAFVRDMTETRRRRAEVDLELRRQLTAAAPDAARVEELTAAKAELFLTAERTTARTILETRRLLDPEQQRRYLHVLRRLRGGAGGGPGPPPGRGPRRLP